MPRKETIGQQIKRISKARAHRDVATGMLYNVRAELTKRYKKITMIGAFVSDENTFLVRPHVFESKNDPRNARAWELWLEKHYGKILRDTILPGMEARTGKQWRLYRIIGWMANDNSGLVRAKTRKARNKTKSKRR